MNYPPRSPHRNLSTLLLAGIFLTLAFLSAPALRAEGVEYKLNDRVETNLSVFGWEKGTVVEVGTGDDAGKVKVLVDGRAKGFASWVKPESGFIRKLAGAAPAAPAADANTPPRLGKYDIFAFGAGGKHLYLGHFELQVGGKYRVSRTKAGEYFGEGTYAFDAAAKSVKWLSGPYKDEAGWVGGFEINRAGKSHEIRLRKTVLATNSVE